MVDIALLLPSLLQGHPTCIDVTWHSRSTPWLDMFSWNATAWGCGTRASESKIQVHVSLLLCRNAVKMIHTIARYYNTTDSWMLLWMPFDTAKSKSKCVWFLRGSSQFSCLLGIVVLIKKGTSLLPVTFQCAAWSRNAWPTFSQRLPTRWLPTARTSEKELMNSLIHCDFCTSRYARCHTIGFIGFHLGPAIPVKLFLVQECVLEGEESEFLWQKDPLVLVQMLGSKHG